jgi:membrane protein DedA with SNARE-associated domain
MQHLLETWGYLAVFLLVGVEAMGIPLPGETILIAAGAYAGAGHLNIALVIAAAALGGILGNNAGYLIGRTGGRTIAQRYGRYVGLNDQRLDAAERFFERHGDKTVFLGRFVAVLRTWAAFLAGLSRMPWPKFLAFNAAGGILWALLFGVLAFELGRNLPLLHRVVDALGLAGIGLAVIVGAVLFVVYRRAKALEARLLDEDEGEEKRRAST